MHTKYIPVIGLEIHVELKTKSKMFCQCAADYFGKEPNTNTCPVCLGMPGALPVPNRQAVDWTIKIGQALGCTINKHSKFDRKHYFYPDLPKAYQISQYDEPFAIQGELVIASAAKQSNNKEIATSTTSPRNDKKIGITRVHLEEDTGKLTHAGDDTLVDFNRSSVPLVEIVTEPCFDNSDDVKMFLEELHTIIKYLDVSDANMEEGSMRMEPNISLRVTSSSRAKRGDPSEIATSTSSPRNDFELPNYKVEVKNINSFNFAKRAIDYELKRQAEILDRGETPAQETRGYNEEKGITYAQRSKEEAQDYRYFPEPDIPPMEFSDEEIETIRKTIPELPTEKCSRYVDMLKVKFEDAFILTRTASLSIYFEEILEKMKGDSSLPQRIANAIINKKIPSDIPISDFIAKFVEMNKPVEVDEVALKEAIEKILSLSAPQIAQYKAGKIGLMGYFIGQVMKEMNGQADPQAVQKLMKERLN